MEVEEENKKEIDFPKIIERIFHKSNEESAWALLKNGDIDRLEDLLNLLAEKRMILPSIVYITEDGLLKEIEKLEWYKRLSEEEKEVLGKKLKTIIGDYQIAIYTRKENEKGLVNSFQELYS